MKTTTTTTKQSPHYDRAEQIPAFTFFGWRRLRPEEKIKAGDIYTAVYNDVNLSTMCQCTPTCLLPNGGFIKANDNHSGKTSEELGWTTRLVVLRPWFPNRSPFRKLTTTTNTTTTTTTTTNV